MGGHCRSQFTGVLRYGQDSYGLQEDMTQVWRLIVSGVLSCSFEGGLNGCARRIHAVFLAVVHLFATIYGNTASFRYPYFPCPERLSRRMMLPLLHCRRVSALFMSKVLGITSQIGKLHVFLYCALTTSTIHYPPPSSSTEPHPQWRITN